MYFYIYMYIFMYIFVNNAILDAVQKEDSTYWTVCSSALLKNMHLCALQGSVCLHEHSTKTQTHKALAHKNGFHFVLIYDSKL